MFEQTIQLIPLNEIFSDEDFNCRQERITPFDVKDLTDDIKKNGLIQPIIIQPYKHDGLKYRIVVGHRRFQAFRNLRKEDEQYSSIPAIVRDDLDEVHAAALNISENLKRKDLNILQESKAIERFRVLGMRMQDICDLLDVSMGWVQVRFNLLDLPYEIQKEAAAGFLTQTHIKDLFSLRDRDKQFEAVRRIKEAKLKGDKRNLLVDKKRKINPHLKGKAVSQQDMFRMQDYLTELSIEPGFATRMLAWCAGIISLSEFLGDIRAEVGSTYVPPDWIHT